MGAYHGRFSFETFSHRRSCLIKDFRWEVVNRLRYPPSSEELMQLTKLFLLKQCNRSTVGQLISTLLAAVKAVVAKVSLGFCCPCGCVLPALFPEPLLTLHHPVPLISAPSPEGSSLFLCLSRCCASIERGDGQPAHGPAVDSLQSYC